MPVSAEQFEKYQKFLGEQIFTPGFFQIRPKHTSLALHDWPESNQDRGVGPTLFDSGFLPKR